MLTVMLTSQSRESAVTAAAAALSTILDNTKTAGQAIYALVSNTDCWFCQGIADTTFTVAPATDIFTANGHKLTTGMVVQVSSSTTLPAGLSAATNYWVGVIDVNTFYLYDTLAHAQAGGTTGRIDATDAGTGTHTMTTTAVAGAGSTFIPAGLAVPIDGSLGAKLSIIRDSADGKASITPCMVVR